tara:strand:- start:528 stop:746 length:219 start_codon:yes stop_codon:yes gene_type:complete
MANKPHLTFVEQLKQNPLIFTIVGLIIASEAEEIEGFTGIPIQAVGIFAVILTIVPLVPLFRKFLFWLKKRK